ncbi:hypothetical protein KY348_02480 [Candidatus Woesearchaeota archaeon]|nr:hypothetical protein [Candidatus Woesearchaeota archaeon]
MNIILNFLLKSFLRRSLIPMNKKKINTIKEIKKNDKIGATDINERSTRA